MVNAALAFLTLVVWSLAYGLFFRRELVRWWKTRPARREFKAAQREQALRAYAAWVRNIPPPRPRAPSKRVNLPVTEPPPRPRPQPSRNGNVVPFPRGGRAKQR